MCVEGRRERCDFFVVVTVCNRLSYFPYLIADILHKFSHHTIEIVQVNRMHISDNKRHEIVFVIYVECLLFTSHIYIHLEGIFSILFMV